MSILELFCHVDDFCQWMATWENAKLLGVARKRGPAPRLSLSEVMTILIHFHQSHYRDFKAYYKQHVSQHMRSEFPGLVSYTRIVELMPSALPALYFYLYGRFGQTTGVAFIDSTPLPVCHNKRIGRPGRPKVGSLLMWPRAARAVWAGSMASSSICLSMTKVNCWLFNSRRAM